jgi:hypothetical protein
VDGLQQVAIRQTLAFKRAQHEKAMQQSFLKVHRHLRRPRRRAGKNAGANQQDAKRLVAHEYKPPDQRAK